MARKKKPWERLPEESDPAFKAFCCYRDMPYETGMKRSLDRVRRKLGKSQRLMEQWSAKYDWVSRVAEYDSFMDEQALEERLKAQRKRIQQEEQMDDRHVSLSIQLQSLIVNAIQNVSPEEITPKWLNDLTKASKNATEMERVSRHTSIPDRELELKRESFEHKRQMDWGIGEEYEYIEDVEADIYGDGDGGSEGDKA